MYVHTSIHVHIYIYKYINFNSGILRSVGKRDERNSTMHAADHSEKIYTYLFVYVYIFK
jgi:hypothetical protein